ncbi:MAG: F-box protein [Bdellovibrionales bacterium]
MESAGAAEDYNLEYANLLAKMREVCQTMQIAIQRYNDIQKQMDVMVLSPNARLKAPKYLPHEILQMIAFECDPVSYLRMALTCRSLRNDLLSKQGLLRYLRKCELRWNMPMAIARAAIEALDSPNHIFTVSMILMHMSPPWVFNGQIQPSGGSTFYVNSDWPEASNIPKGALCISDQYIIYANGTRKLSDSCSIRTIYLGCNDRVLVLSDSRDVFDLTEGLKIASGVSVFFDIETSRNGRYAAKDDKSVYVFNGLSENPSFVKVLDYKNMIQGDDGDLSRVIFTDDADICCIFRPGAAFSIKNQQYVSEDAVLSNNRFATPTNKQKQTHPTRTWHRSLQCSRMDMHSCWKGWTLSYYKDLDEIRVLEPDGREFSSFKLVGTVCPWTINDLGILSDGSQFFFFTFKSQRTRKNAWQHN